MISPARSFIDPTFTHFAQVLLTGCLMVIPTMRPALLGVLLLGIAAMRAAALVRIFGHMLQAHRTHGEIELSDWLTGVVVPLLCFLVLGASGAGFVARYAEAFDGLALATVLILLNGVYGVWELIIWMVVTRAKKA